jgi:hypothetical protein
VAGIGGFQAAIGDRAGAVSGWRGKRFRVTRSQRTNADQRRNRGERRVRRDNLDSEVFAPSAVSSSSHCFNARPHWRTIVEPRSTRRSARQIAPLQCRVDRRDRDR